MTIAQSIGQLPAISVLYTVLAALFFQLAIWAHLIGTGALATLVERAGLSGDYSFLTGLSGSTRDRVRAGRAPALVLGCACLLIAVVTAVVELPGILR